jgi:long-chain fatty acid transport protein
MKKLILIVCMAFPVIASAGGFQINAQSQKANGMGGTGTGSGSDASSVFFNPGGISLQEKSSVMVGFDFINPRSSYLSPINGNIDAQKQSFTPIYFYGFYKIKKFAVGLGVNNPYGLGADWGDEWEGKFIIQKIKLTTFYIQPTISYKINDKVGIGAGLVIGTGKATIRKAVPVNGDNTNYGEVDLKGNGTGVGFNAAVLVKLSEKATVGLSYKSKIKLKLKNGDATFSDIPASLADQFPASTNFNSQLNLPSTLSVGLGYKFTEKLLVAFDLNLTGWSVYDSLNFIFPDYESLDQRSARKYKNVVAIRLGGQYAVTSKINVRAGITFDQSPVQKGYMSPELPDANKTAFSLGVGYKITSSLSADAGFIYESLAERKDTNTETQFSGKYKTNITIFGIEINYAF